jgi:predicted Zn-dependent peptidase
MDKLQKELYPGHPYGKLILGSAQTVSPLTEQNVKYFYEQKIRQTPLVISVAGNFNPAKTKKILTQALGSWGKDVEIKTFQTSSFTQNKTIEVKQKMNAVNFLMAYSAPAGYSKDFVALQVLNNILGGKSSSRIFSQIRESKGLGYALGSFYPLRKESSQFVLYITVDPKAKKQFPNLFLKIVNDLKNMPVSQSELQAAQTHLKAKFLMDHQTTSQRAWYLGLYENLGLGAAFDNGYEKQIEAVTIKDIQKAAQKYLTHYLLIRQEPGPPAP